MARFPWPLPNPARPRRRRTVALFGGATIAGAVVVFFSRSCAGNAVGARCESSNDCKRALVCAEALEGDTKKKKGDGIKQCAKPCMSNADCGEGLSCGEAYEHTLGPRGGKHKDKVRACVGGTP